MRKIFSLALLVLAISCVQAQTFKPFKVDVSAGYAIPQGKGSKGGALFVVEPKYALMDELSLGLRLESAIIANVYEVNGESMSGKVKALGSYLLTGDYYFSTNNFRPFGGAGLGLYKIAGASIDMGTTTEDIEVKGESRFGGMLRGGFEYKHFRTGIEYNFVGKKSGYLGIKLGFCIGGGRL